MNECRSTDIQLPLNKLSMEFGEAEQTMTFFLLPITDCPGNLARTSTAVEMSLIVITF